VSFVAELKRRNVFRAAAAYVAVAWLTIQVAETTFPAFDFGDRALRLLILALAVGFVPAVALAWAFELTPEGLKRERDLDRDGPLSRRTNRLLDRVIVLLLALGLTYFAVDKFFLSPAREQARVEQAVQQGRSEALAEALSEKSIVVLPFANLSSDAEQTYFSDGVTEEILNLLTDVDGLRVISRTSAFSFKGTQASLPEIAQKLGVGYVVEGSVRTAGDRVRVTAQLIDVAADQQLWSETYERQLVDVFDIQTDVAGQVARVLKIALGAEELTSIGRAPTSNLEAWQRFLKARYLLRNRTTVGDLQEALALVDAAIQLDPAFARAHSLRAMILLLRPVWEGANSDFEMQRAGGATAAEIERLEVDWSEAMRETEIALQLDPRLGEPHAVRALHAQARNRYAEASRSFRWALGRAPSNPDIRNWYGSFLLETGHVQAALAEKVRAAELDPLSPIIAWQLAYTGLAIGRTELMMDFSAKARANGWQGWQAWAVEGGAALLQRDMEEAERRFIRALPEREPQIRMSFDVLRKRRIDAAARAMLDTLEPYGPPGIGRYAVEALSGNVDAALATILGTIDPASLRGADGSGGPPRPAAGNRPGSVLRGDWWFHSTPAVRRDPRFVELMHRVGLVDFWRQRGWPDLCRPVGDTVECQ